MKWVKFINPLVLVLGIILLIGPSFLLADDSSGLVAWWPMEKLVKDRLLDQSSENLDSLSGNYRFVRGVKGKALKFDGYTTVVRRNASRVFQIGDAFTVEAWVAVAAYPWNWCPVVIHQNSEGGYAFEIGPLGELKFKVFAGGEWKECVSEAKIPLKQWTQVVAVFDENSGSSIYLNGQEVGRLAFRGIFKDAEKTDLWLGTIPERRKPAFIHRQFGSLPSWYSLDAILDEIKVYSRAMSAEEILKAYRQDKPSSAPDIPPRELPRIPERRNRFGAFYTRLNYYWEWDELWRVGDHPDVVVTFDQSPVRVVFWRGTRYSPCWVTENNIWMADQSVEAWDNKEGCFEHMQDRHCRYSHVRIIENTPARVVIHWRYALVSSRNHIWNEDERSGWGCWVDEYYYIYPDQTGVRKYSWQKGSLGPVRQFQESIPLTSPGQLQGDIINKDYVTVANLKGEKQVFSYVENPPKKTTKFIPENPLIQMHNTKSRFKPFIIFEPGGKMHYLKDMDIRALSRPGSCSHWPVGQVLSDGRTQKTPDRATSFLGFPITDPVIHEGPEGRNWAASLYGMTNKPFDTLIPLARSWACAPKLEILAGEFDNGGYDLSQRAYVIKPKNLKPKKLKAKNIKDKNLSSSRFLEAIIKANDDSPVDNLCLVIKNWRGKEPILLLNGRKMRKGNDFRTGKIRTLEGEDLILWIPLFSQEPVRIRLEEYRSQSD